MKTEKRELSQEEAKTLYKESGEGGKKILIEKYGKEFFHPKRPETIEEVIKMVNPDADVLALLNYKGTNPFMIGAINHVLGEMISDVLNGGWIATFKDGEKRWIPVFNTAGGFGFSNSYCDAWDSSTLVGSRLCFKDKETSDYAGQTFPQVYKALFIKNPK